MQHIYRFLSRRHIWRLLSLLVVDMVLFGLTNARQVPSIILIIGLLLLGLTIYYAISGILAAASLYGITLKRKRRLAGSLAGLTCGLIALQSIGELSPRDVAVLLPLVTLGYLYSFYAKNGKLRQEER